MYIYIYVYIYIYISTLACIYISTLACAWYPQASVLSQKTKICLPASMSPCRV